jgi:hypothetical protein
LVTTIGRIPFNTQLDWLWAELQGPEKKTWQNFLTNPNLITPQEFAKAFESTYERADGKHLEKRQNYAKDVFSAFSNNNLSNISPNAAKTVNYLTDKGMTLAQAAGVTGNLMAESGFDIDPDAYNPSGGGMGGYGIAQWRGDRQTGLQNYFNRTRPEEEKQMVMPAEKDDFLTMLKKGASGLYNAVTERPEGQLLSGGERFARALDPLVMPELRMGDKITANAIAQRKYEETAGNRNRTMNVLKGLAAQGDQVAAKVLASVEARALLPKDAMTIYYREKFAKPDVSYTQKSGAELGYEGDMATQTFNVSSTGKVTPLKQGGDTIIGGTEKEAQKVMGNKLTNMFFDMVNEGNEARGALGQIGMLRSIMMDPKFTTGSLTEGKMAATKLYAALGGNVENLEGVGALETFDALSKELILAKMGGKLGAGFSDGDRFFVERQSPQLGNTKMGNLQILLINQIIEERKALLAKMAIKYANDPERKGKSPIDTQFLSALQKFGEENSIKDIYEERMSELDEFFN